MREGVLNRSEISDFFGNEFESHNHIVRWGQVIKLTLLASQNGFPTTLVSCISFLGEAFWPIVPRELLLTRLSKVIRNVSVIVIPALWSAS
jgi:hypothetical protein